MRITIKPTMIWLIITLILMAGCNRMSTHQPEVDGLKSRSPTPSHVQPDQLSSNTMADYEPIPLDRLIGTAQLIVLGEVTKVSNHTFSLRVSQQLAGATAANEIEIRQYIPSKFEGSPRPAPYAIGQSFLLFLTPGKPSPTDSAWTIMGIGGEGEMPIEGDFIYFHGRNVEGLPFESHQVHKAQRSIQRFVSQEFFDAVKKYRFCFEWKPGKEGRPEPAKTCDEAAIAKYAQVSAIHSYLARLTSRRITK